MTVHCAGCPIFGVREELSRNLGRQTGYPGLPIKMPHGT